MALGERETLSAKAAISVWVMNTSRDTVQQIDRILIRNPLKPLINPEPFILNGSRPYPVSVLNIVSVYSWQDPQSKNRIRSFHIPASIKSRSFPNMILQDLEQDSVASVINLDQKNDQGLKSNPSRNLNRILMYQSDILEQGTIKI